MSSVTNNPEKPIDPVVIQDFQAHGSKLEKMRGEKLSTTSKTAIVSSTLKNSGHEAKISKFQTNVTMPRNYVDGSLPPYDFISKLISKIFEGIASIRHHIAGHFVKHMENSVKQIKIAQEKLNKAEKNLVSLKFELSMVTREAENLQQSSVAPNPKASVEAEKRKEELKSKITEAETQVAEGNKQLQQVYNRWLGIMKPPENFDEAMNNFLAATEIKNDLNSKISELEKGPHDENYLQSLRDKQEKAGNVLRDTMKEMQKFKPPEG